MKINIIAEPQTTQEIIDKLIEETPKLFQDSCSIELVDTRERYEIKKSKILHYGETIGIEEIESLDGMQIGKLFLFNVRPLVLKHQPKNPEEKTMVLTHQSYVYMNKELDPIGLIPKFVGKTITDEEWYSGSCVNNHTAVVVGIPNEPHSNNIKIAAHEIAHLFLDPVFSSFVNGKQKNHCENTAEGNLKCIMNTPAYVTRRTMKEIGLGFCDPCYKKLKKASMY